MENPLRQPCGLPPPRAGEEFTTSALRLSGQAGALLGWRPHEFWSATPAELAAILTALSGDTATPPAAAELARLTEMFPDG